MEHKQHICFLQYNLQGGGAERKVCTLANYFAAQGHTVEVGLFGANNIAYPLDERIKVTFLRRENYEYRSNVETCIYTVRSILLQLSFNLLKIVSRSLAVKVKKHFDKSLNYTSPIQRYILNRPDAVFITMMVSTYLEVLKVMERYWKEQIPVPYLVMDCSDPKRNADREMDRKRTDKYPRASRVLVMTQEAKAYFNDEIQKKCEVIPNPIRDDLPAPYHGERRKTVVTYCRLNRQKNLPLLLDAFDLFHKRFQEYSLEIYGEGEEREALYSLIWEKGLDMAVTIQPFDPKVHQKIKDCAMFVSSSDWEGFPNSVLEALALGMPVISTDCDYGPRDMIEDHVNGLLTPVGDVQALTDAMIELAESPALAQALGEKAVAVRDKYASEIICRQWLDLIEEVKKEFS